MTDFANGEHAQDEIAPYSIVDEGRLRFMLSSRDFIQAFTVSLRMLGACFVYPPTDEGSLGALQTIRSMDVSQNWPFGGSRPLMQVVMMLAQGQMESQSELESEFQRLFRNADTCVAPPFGSVFMDPSQTMRGWTWKALCDWMTAHGINAQYEEDEPEDQFGRLMVLAAELANACPNLLAEFLGDHLLCWSGRYLELFQTDRIPLTYRGLAMLASITLDDVQETLGILPAKRVFYR